MNAADKALAVPSLSWAIADYGMEDQLLPLVDALVQILRSKYPDVGRRPLETTARIADYVRLREASQ